MKIEKLYQDYNIHIAQSGERHYRYGWINTSCPFCTGNQGNHLGYNIKENYFFCHRCGFHSHKEVIKALTNESDLIRVFKTYKGIPTYQKQKIKPVKQSKTLKTPNNLLPLTQYHRNYLKNRNFDPDELIKKWGICSTSPISKLDYYDYSNRIFAPIYWCGKKVSFQCRVTKESNVKYKTCPPEYEAVFHKDILYGNQNYWSKTGIVVEGVTDVWRLGVYACATFGTKYTNAQVKIIAKNFKKVAVMYDGDEAGNMNADKMISELLFLGVDAFRVVPDSDPGDMKKNEVDYLIKKIME
jgi:hypothetical protein